MDVCIFSRSCRSCGDRQSNLEQSFQLSFFLWLVSGLELSCFGKQNGVFTKWTELWDCGGHLFTITYTPLLLCLLDLTHLLKAELSCGLFVFSVLVFGDAHFLAACFLFYCFMWFDGAIL